jgi:hypothetical protein
MYVTNKLSHRLTVSLNQQPAPYPLVMVAKLITSVTDADPNRSLSPAHAAPRPPPNLGRYRDINPTLDLNQHYSYTQLDHV